jgi:Ni,Fe-hydrogenase III small subunit/NAD-dependent dihydropyrimidine dehydrogenase PreA subunit
MLRALQTRLQQGKRTIGFPKSEPVLPDRFQGLPTIRPSGCPAQCRECADSCPTSAITPKDDRVQLDLGKCLYCGECERACSAGTIHFTRDYRMAATQRSALVIDESGLKKGLELDKKMRRLFGRSLKLRQVSAGGCNACEADVNVLNTVVFDLGRFGIQFVASPRHADGLLITGPVTENMRLALQKTYDAVASPKLVIAAGACAISGGPFADLPQVLNGAAEILPVDLFIPGCPPHPVTLLDALLRWLGQ